MGNWLEERAVADHILWRDGAESWRQFKDSAEVIVNTFNVIYAQPGIKEVQLGGCADATDNCFRVRTIPMPTQKERYVEFRYIIDRHTVEVVDNERSSTGTFRLSLNQEKQIVLTDKEDREISVTAAVKATLEKFLLPEPRRPLKLPHNP